MDFLLKEARATVEKYFSVVELGDREVGLVLKNGKIAGVLAPGTRQLYWRGPIDVSVEVHDIGDGVRASPKLAKSARAREAAAGCGGLEAVSAVEVPDTAVGLLIVDG